MRVYSIFRFRFSICFLFAVGFSIGTSAIPSKQSDSLIQSIKAAPDSLLPKLYYKIAWSLRKEDKASSKRYNLMAIQEGRKQNKNYWVGVSEISLSRSLMDESKYDSADVLATDAIALLKGSRDSAQLRDAYLTRGNACVYRGLYDKALASYLGGLDLSPKNKPTKARGSSLANIAEVYNRIKNYPMSLEYYAKAADMCRELKDSARLIFILGNIASVYGNMGAVDKSLAYYLEALGLSEKRGDEAEIAYLETNLGESYNQKKDYKKAEEYLRKSYEIQTRLQDKEGMAISLVHLASTRLNMGDAKGSTDLGLQSLAIAREIKLQSTVKGCYVILSDAYFKSGNYKEAAEYSRKAGFLSDSIYGEESLRLLNEMQAKYESSEKEQQIKDLEKNKTIQGLELARQESDNKRQRIFLGLVGIAFVFVAALAFFIFRGYRQKQKANEIITLQKQEVERQKILVDEKNKEILDSITYAKRIQGAILPPAKYISSLLPDSFILYKPKDIVSGDIYWIEKNGETVFVAAVDCTGHGVPGAMVSVVAQNNLNRCVKEFGLTEPASILDKLNTLVEELFSRSEDEVKDGMDISLCALTKSSGNKRKLKWAGANNPIWLFQGEGDQGVKEYTGDKQPIGKHTSRQNFTAHEIEVEKGTMAYIFSDGFADQFGGPSGKKFKYKSFRKLLGTIHQLPAEEQKKALDKAIEEWKGSLEQVDDILVIGIRL